MRIRILIGITIVAGLSYFTLSCCNKNNQVNDQQQEEQLTQPKNIILMIGDGMGVSHVSAVLTIKKDNLNMARCKHIGFSKTSSANEYITDSGASATTMATGNKTNNQMISVDPNGKELKTILEYAEENDLSTGLVATSFITHATPAGFIAHNPDRHDYEGIAMDFINTDIDFFAGGGLKHFTERQDQLNLIDSLVANKYEIVYDTIAMQESENDKVAALLYDEHPPKYTDGRGNMLSKASAKAIDILSKNKNGFFLMIEGSQIDWAGHDNDAEYLITETLDFDNAVGVVLDFAEKNKETLVIITADHECGGYGITGGNMKEGVVKGEFLCDHHTPVIVPVFAYGPGAEDFTGIYENTKIFNKCMKAFGFKYE